jgi:hypothetical protein
VTEIQYKAPPVLDRIERSALVVGIAALAVCAVGAYVKGDAFFRSYLLAYAFAVGIALGCLSIVLVQHLSGGAWGLMIRRVLESATRTFPVLAVMFVPVLLGLRLIYPWAQPETVAGDPMLTHKAKYLNVPFFAARAVVYFAIWLLLAHFLNKWSRQQDETGDKEMKRRLQDVSGPALLLVGGTVTFAAIDWLMSLDPHWFSTIFGILVLGGQALSAMAFVIAIMFLLSNHKPMSDALTPRHFHDLGKLLLAFVMLWAYFSFSQFLITWSGNLPEEIPWYLGRLHGPWRWIAGFIILFHFVLPFLLLLPRSANRNARLLSKVALLIIVMRYVDLFWLIGPSHHAGHASWADYVAPIVAPIGLGGVWFAFFLRQLKSRPLLPIGDPELEGALSFGRGEHQS